MDISRRSVHRIIKNGLHRKGFKRFTSQDLNEKHIAERSKRSEKVLAVRRSKRLPNLVFSDGKTFFAEQYVNHQNDRVYLAGLSSDHLDELRVPRKQEAAQIMDWAAVSENDGSPLIFLIWEPKKSKLTEEFMGKECCKLLCYRMHVNNPVRSPGHSNRLGSIAPSQWYARMVEKKTFHTSSTD